MRRALRIASRRRLTAMVLFAVAALLIAGAALGWVVGAAFAACYAAATVALLLIAYGLVSIGRARAIESLAIDRVGR